MCGAWLKAGVVEFGQLKRTEEGSPQGGIISPTPANMTLDGLEKLLGLHFGEKGSKKIRENKTYCALCGEPITKENHIVYQMFGGSDALNNRCLVHPNCHVKIHALNLDVVKPAYG